MISVYLLLDCARFLPMSLTIFAPDVEVSKKIVNFASKSAYAADKDHPM